MPATDWWWRQASGVRRRIADLPFVRQLGDGTLPEDQFIGYLAQDMLYLEAYSKVLAAAGRLAPDRTAQEFWEHSSALAVQTELRLHTSWVPESVSARTLASPVTTAYLDHLRKAEASKDYTVLTAALLPCFWIYAEIGESLVAQNRPGHPYAEWLETYADDGFAESTRQAIRIAADAAESASPTARVDAAEAFHTSCRHELNFFAAPLVRH
ncbi:TenA family protein [Cellulomonas soli]